MQSAKTILKSARRSRGSVSRAEVRKAVDIVYARRKARASRTRRSNARIASTASINNAN